MRCWPGWEVDLGGLCVGCVASLSSSVAWKGEGDRFVGLFRKGSGVYTSSRKVGQLITQ